MNTRDHLKRWEGKYGGVPQFSKFTTDDLQPAIEEAIAGENSTY